MRNSKLYKNLIFSDQETCSSIMKKINLPSSVFKYRCFCRETKEGLKEDLFWKESMNGIVYYSLAKDFNRNDPDDCILKYNRNAIIDAVYKQMGRKGKRNYKSNQYIDRIMGEYIYQIRDNFRIGCFTTRRPEDGYMWDEINFGGNHTGYCIEYETIKEVMFPGTIKFLPVLYHPDRYDSTKVICNLIKNNGNVDSLEVISLAYNFALVKPKKYFQEKEWRVIVTQNRYDDYFNVDKDKIDFSNIMKAIYLGKDYKKYDPLKKKYQYALQICQSKNIPLYKMEEENKKLVKRCLYDPNIN